MFKAFCLATTLSTAAILLPLAPKFAQAAGCYLVTPDGWHVDLSVLCQRSNSPQSGTVPVQNGAASPGQNVVVPVQNGAAFPGQNVVPVQNGAAFPGQNVVPTQGRSFDQRLSLSQSSTSNYRNRWGLGLDMSAYCQQKYGANTVLILQENNAAGWRCLTGNQAQEISYVEACSSQYGPSAVAAMGNFQDINSWHCRLTSNVSYQTSGS